MYLKYIQFLRGAGISTLRQTFGIVHIFFKWTRNILGMHRLSRIQPDLAHFITSVIHWVYYNVLMDRLKRWVLTEMRFKTWCVYWVQNSVTLSGQVGARTRANPWTYPEPCFWEENQVPCGDATLRPSHRDNVLIQCRNKATRDSMQFFGLTLGITPELSSCVGEALKVWGQSATPCSWTGVGASSGITAQLWFKIPQKRLMPCHMHKLHSVNFSGPKREVVQGTE